MEGMSRSDSEKRAGGSSAGGAAGVLIVTRDEQ